MSKSWKYNFESLDQNRIIDTSHEQGDRDLPWYGPKRETLEQESNEDF